MTHINLARLNYPITLASIYNSNIFLPVFLAILHVLEEN